MLAAGLLAALAALFFAPSLFLGKTLLLRDLQSQFYAPRWWYAATLHAGHLPHWNPYILCGTPFLANPQNSVFYPLSLLFVVFPTAYAFAVFSALHCFLLGFFSHLLGRRWGLSFWAALFLGLTTGFGGIPLKEIEFPEMLAGLAWTPLVLLGAWECLIQPRRRASALAGLAFGLQLLAGSPYPPFYSLLGILCLVLAQGLGVGSRPSRPPVGASVISLGGGLFLGLLIGGMQYVPTLILTRDLPDFALAGSLPVTFSLRLRDLFHYLSPWLVGFPYWQKCFYAGLPALFLLVIGAVCRIAFSNRETTTPPSQSLSNTATLSCVFFVLLGGALAQAGYLGLDHLADTWGFIGRPLKWPTLGMSLVVIGGAMLAAGSIDRLGHEMHSRRKIPLFAGALVCLFAGMVGLDAIRGCPWLSWLRGYVHQQMVVYPSASLDSSHYPLTPEAWRIAACSAAFGLILIFGPNKKLHRWFGPAMCLLAAGDLFSANRNLNFQADQNLYAEKPAMLAQLEQNQPGGELRRIGVPTELGHLNDLGYGSQSLDELRFLRNLLGDDIAMPWRAFSTQGTGSVRLPSYQFQLQPVLDGLIVANSDAADRILGAWNVSAVMNGEMQADGFHGGVRLNPHVLPRARLLDRVRVIPDDADALNQLARMEWDPSTLLITRRSPALQSAAAGFVPTTDEPGAVAQIEYGFDEIRVACTVRRPCVLVLAENWAEGWSVRVDGAPAEDHRVNFLQQGVLMSPGAHEVVFHYTTPGFGLGLMLGGLGLAGVGFCVVSGGRKKTPSPLAAGTE